LLPNHYQLRGSVFPRIWEKKGIAANKGDRASSEYSATRSFVGRSEHEKRINKSKVDGGSGVVGVNGIHGLGKFGCPGLGHIEVSFWECCSCLGIAVY
jgi:hypothetical protein